MTARTLTLLPTGFKMLLLTAGVLLGLLAIALLVGPHAAAGSHATIVDGAAKLHIFGRLRPMGVLWH